MMTIFFRKTREDKTMSGLIDPYVDTVPSAEDIAIVIDRPAIQRLNHNLILKLINTFGHHFFTSVALRLFLLSPASQTFNLFQPYQRKLYQCANSIRLRPVFEGS